MSFAPATRNLYIRPIRVYERQRERERERVKTLIVIVGLTYDLEKAMFQWRLMRTELFAGDGTRQALM